MSKIKKPYKSKSIKSVDVGQSFNSEESPYWQFLDRCSKDGNDGKIIEDPLANPDIFAEDDSVFNRPLSDLGQLQVDVIHEIMPTLSPQQRRVLELCGFDGRTLEVAAQTLGIKVATVQVLLQRARAKIVRRFEQRLKAEEK